MANSLPTPWHVRSVLKCAAGVRMRRRRGAPRNRRANPLRRRSPAARTPRKAGPRPTRKRRRRLRPSPRTITVEPSGLQARRPRRTLLRRRLHPRPPVHLKSASQRKTNPFPGGGRGRPAESLRPCRRGASAPTPLPPSRCPRRPSQSRFTSREPQSPPRPRLPKRCSSRPLWSRLLCRRDARCAPRKVLLNREGRG